MTIEELEAFFEDDKEFLKFDRIENKRSNRPDLHAFLLLDELVPGTTDMVSAAEHDEIYLAVDLCDLAEVVSKEQVIELIRCGVRHGEFGLCMFA